LSRPAWARGLKPNNAPIVAAIAASRPAWARGLKLTIGKPNYEEREVAPRVGAWIETRPVYPMQQTAMVAPRVGAWIETYWRRGQRPGQHVAPRVGAWIETIGAVFDRRREGGRAPRGRVD